MTLGTFLCTALHLKRAVYFIGEHLLLLLLLRGRLERSTTATATPPDENRERTRTIFVLNSLFFVSHNKRKCNFIANVQDKNVTNGASKKF